MYYKNYIMNLQNPSGHYYKQILPAFLLFLSLNLSTKNKYKNCFKINFIFILFKLNLIIVIKCVHYPLGH